MKQKCNHCEQAGLECMMDDDGNRLVFHRKENGVDMYRTEVPIEDCNLISFDRRVINKGIRNITDNGVKTLATSTLYL